MLKKVGYVVAVGLALIAQSAMADVKVITGTDALKGAGGIVIKTEAYSGLHGISCDIGYVMVSCSAERHSTNNYGVSDTSAAGSITGNVLGLVLPKYDSTTNPTTCYVPAEDGWSWHEYTATCAKVCQ